MVIIYNPNFNKQRYNALEVIGISYLLYGVAYLVGLDTGARESHIDYNTASLKIMARALSYYGFTRLSQGNFGIRVSHPKLNWMNYFFWIILTLYRIYLLYEFLTKVQSDLKTLFWLSLKFDLSFQ